MFTSSSSGFSKNRDISKVVVREYRTKKVLEKWIIEEPPLLKPRVPSIKYYLFERIEAYYVHQW